MTAEQKRLVQASFAKVQPIADAAAAMFYARLFELDPSVRPLFKTDLTEQGQKLMRMIGMAVNGLERLDELVPAVRQLGIRHVGYGVTDAHYDTVAAALLWTLERGLGLDFTPDVERAWVEVYGVRHYVESAGFLSGRHGMRTAAGLSPMSPAMARRPMRADAHGRQLSCASCHRAHEFDTRKAAVDTCLACHDDGHSRSYVDSPHAALWSRERAKAAPPGSGVSCATCHMPRRSQKVDGAEVIRVQHNQNANLRPNEKMLRSVCLSCHGLGFSLDALADSALVAANFNGRPSRSVDVIEMAMKR